MIEEKYNYKHQDKADYEDYSKHHEYSIQGLRSLSMIGLIAKVCKEKASGCSLESASDLCSKGIRREGDSFGAR
jgi:hypothetical protein